MRALLVAVIVMGVMIVVGTAIVISVVIRRAVQGTPAAAMSAASASITSMPGGSMVALDQPPGTHILSLTRQSDTLLAIILTGGGPADRLVIWDIASGRVVARLTLDR